MLFAAILRNIMMNQMQGEVLHCKRCEMAASLNRLKAMYPQNLRDLPRQNRCRLSCECGQKDLTILVEWYKHNTKTSNLNLGAPDHLHLRCAQHLSAALHKWPPVIVYTHPHI